MFRILLADDNPRIHELVRSLLDSHFEVIASVHHGRALIEAVAKFRPDVIVTDIAMPVLNGIDAANQLKESGNGARVVFLTVHEDPDFIDACLATGALGYVTKPRMARDLVPAIQEALNGRTFVSAASSDGRDQDFSQNIPRAAKVNDFERKANVFAFVTQWYILVPVWCHFATLRHHSPPVL